MADPQRPTAVTVPIDLYDQVTSVLLSLPAGQVMELLLALRSGVEPVYTEERDEAPESA